MSKFIKILLIELILPSEKYTTVSLSTKEVW